jgi:hypothetical protein
MPASKAKNHAEKVIHIIGTYGLPLQPDVLESFRKSLSGSTQKSCHLLSEEEAAMVLARHLYPKVTAALRSGNDSPVVDAILDAWARFAQQAMYRSDLGLIHMALFNEEILPLIDDVERTFREKILIGENSRTNPALA